jgi:hypothetical protein
VDEFIEQVRSEAKQILQRLDERFDPRVFLVGLHKTRGVLGIAPRGSPFTTADFDTVLARAAELQAADPDNDCVWMPDPEHGWTEEHQRNQDAKERSMRGKALRQAMTEASAKAPANETYITYCSMPLLADEAEHTVVLQVQKDVHDSHYHLTRGTYEAHRHAYRRDRSLIEAVIHEILHEICDELAKSSSSLRVLGNEDELLARSARHLMRNPAIAGGEYEGLNTLFDVCHELSLLKYEGKDGIGGIIFARPDHPQVKQEIALVKPVPLRSLGAVRKMLQMASGRLSLLSDSRDIYALGSVLSNYDPAAEDVFSITFGKHSTWHLRHGGHTMMVVRHGRPSLTQGFPELRLRRDLPRICPGISDANVVPLPVMLAGLAA